MGLYDFTKIPHGINGVEDRLRLLWGKGVLSGKIDEMRFVSLVSSCAARVYGLYPKKVIF